MKNRVIVVAVHADDETLACGGTLLKHMAQGDEVYWLRVTGPTKNHPAQFSDEIINKHDEHDCMIANCYGFSGFEYLALPSQMLHSVDMREFVQKVSSIFNKIKPNIIYMMYANDVHSDHRVAFDAVYSCTKSFRYPFIEKIYMMETLSETEFAPAVASKTFIPNVYVDITDFIDKKLDIMSLYDTEVMPEPYPRSYSSIRALARVRGSRAGVMYAEAFQLLYEKR